MIPPPVSILLVLMLSFLRNFLFIPLSTGAHILYPCMFLLFYITVVTPSIYPCTEQPLIVYVCHHKHASTTPPPTPQLLGDDEPLTTVLLPPWHASHAAFSRGTSAMTLELEYSHC